MSGPTESPFVALSAVVVVFVSMIGMSRAGFSAAETAVNSTDYANTTAGQLEVFTGTLVELLPVLALVVAGIVVLRTVQ